MDRDSFNAFTRANLSKLRANWQAIIEKYDQPFPDDDEIHLSSLSIAADNGRLRHKAFVRKVIGKSKFAVESRLDLRSLNDSAIGVSRQSTSTEQNLSDENHSDVTTYPLKSDNHETFVVPEPILKIGLEDRQNVNCKIQNHDKDEGEEEPSDAETIPSESSWSSVDEDEEESSDMSIYAGNDELTFSQSATIEVVRDDSKLLDRKPAEPSGEKPEVKTTLSRSNVRTRRIIATRCDDVFDHRYSTILKNPHVKSPCTTLNSTYDVPSEHRVRAESRNLTSYRCDQFESITVQSSSCSNNSAMSTPAKSSRESPARSRSAIPLHRTNSGSVVIAESVSSAYSPGCRSYRTPATPVRQSEICKQFNQLRSRCLGGSEKITSSTTKGGNSKVTRNVENLATPYSQNPSNCTGSSAELLRDATFDCSSRNNVNVGNNTPHSVFKELPIDFLSSSTNSSPSVEMLDCHQKIANTVCDKSHNACWFNQLRSHCFDISAKSPSGATKCLSPSFNNYVLKMDGSTLFNQRCSCFLSESVQLSVDKYVNCCKTTNTSDNNNLSHISPLQNKRCSACCQNYREKECPISIGKALVKPVFISQNSTIVPSQRVTVPSQTSKANNISQSGNQFIRVNNDLTTPTSSGQNLSITTPDVGRPLAIVLSQGDHKVIRVSRDLATSSGLNHTINKGLPLPVVPSQSDRQIIPASKELVKLVASGQNRNIRKDQPPLNVMPSQGDHQAIHVSRDLTIPASSGLNHTRNKGRPVVPSQSDRQIIPASKELVKPVASGQNCNIRKDQPPLNVMPSQGDHQVIHVSRDLKILASSGLNHARDKSQPLPVVQSLSGRQIIPASKPVSSSKNCTTNEDRPLAIVPSHGAISIGLCGKQVSEGKVKASVAFDRHVGIGNDGLSKCNSSEHRRCETSTPRKKSVPALNISFLSAIGEASCDSDSVCSLSSLDTAFVVPVKLSRPILLKAAAKTFTKSSVCTAVPCRLTNNSKVKNDCIKQVFSLEKGDIVTSFAAVSDKTTPRADITLEPDFLLSPTLESSTPEGRRFSGKTRIRQNLTFSGRHLVCENQTPRSRPSSGVKRVWHELSGSSESDGGLDQTLAVECDKTVRKVCARNRSPNYAHSLNCLGPGKCTKAFCFTCLAS